MQPCLQEPNGSDAPGAWCRLGEIRCQHALCGSISAEQLTCDLVQTSASVAAGLAAIALGGSVGICPLGKALAARACSMGACSCACKAYQAYRRQVPAPRSKAVIAVEAGGSNAAPGPPTCLRDFLMDSPLGADPLGQRWHRHWDFL